MIVDGGDSRCVGDTWTVWQGRETKSLAWLSTRDKSIVGN